MNLVKPFFTFKTISFLIALFTIFSCNQESKAELDQSVDKPPKDSLVQIHLLNDIVPKFDSVTVNAVIEIPSGTIEKWELNKLNGQLEWEIQNGKPRIVNYLGYPGNYGFIPQTYLPKDLGGDGDPLDVIVLGPPVERGEILQCKLLGVLYLLDRGEQDDKLIAISKDSPLFEINTLSELNENHIGIQEILSIWFSNYKGKDKMKVKGIGSKEDALHVLNTAIEAYKDNTAD